MKKRSSVTQKQIAKRAGVSQTLVSLALNGSYDVMLSDETRQRVLDVAEEMGYVPQAAAKALVQGRSTNIGLILIQPHYHVFRDPYIPNVITGLSSVVRAQGYRLLVEHIVDRNDLPLISRMLKGGEVAGIVLSMIYGVENIVAPLVAEEYPIVMLDLAPDEYNAVTIDHLTGVRRAVDHIVSLGHHQIGCIMYGPSTPHNDKRVQAFIAALADNDITFNESYLRSGYYNPETGYKAMQELLQLQPIPTAVFGMNDLMAVGAMRAILDAGLRIPEDIAIVGYDDMRFAPFIEPTLTTVRAPEVAQGKFAGNLLIDLINGKQINETQISLDTELVIRASCGSKQ